MKILAILGSPHKGNCLRVIRQVEARMQVHGPVELEILSLKEAGLEPCRGCFGCVLKGEEYCPLKDSRAQIEASMMAADGVIFASPSYSQMVSGLMKNFIDRFSYFAHRPRFFRQAALLISTTYGMGENETLDYMAKIARGWGFHIAARLGVKTWPMAKPEQVTRQIENAADKFYQAVATGRRSSPGVTDLLQFNLMRLNAQAPGSRFQAITPTTRNRAGWRKIITPMPPSRYTLAWLPKR